MEIDLIMLKLRIGNLKANTNNLKFALEDIEGIGIEETIYIDIVGRDLMPKKTPLSKMSLICGIEHQIRQNEIALTKTTRRFEIETKKQQTKK